MITEATKSELIEITTQEVYEMTETVNIVCNNKFKLDKK